IQRTVRLPRISGGSHMQDDDAERIKHAKAIRPCLVYLGAEAKALGFRELATLIDIAAVSAEETWSELVQGAVRRVEVKRKRAPRTESAERVRRTSPQLRLVSG
ncbi:MAG: hypothetical protein K2Q10_00020, partial [Rhodospirillales bacterium]|nr:hypothetical protein [Rhodospirillales bacterium]